MYVCTTYVHTCMHTMNVKYYPANCPLNCTSQPSNINSGGSLDDDISSSTELPLADQTPEEQQKPSKKG